MRQGDDSRVILVVDDQEGNREVLRMFLTESGHIVIEARNGLDALNICTNECPDLIFMDLAMPVMDGYESVRLLRQLPQTRDVPIVAYTAYDTPTHRERTLRTGFNEFLSKPIDSKRLDLVLDRFFNGGALKRT